MRLEGSGSWVAPSLLPSAQHRSVMALMMCSVSPQMELPCHPPTVPVPPGIAAPSLPLSSTVGRTQPKPLCDGKVSCELTFWVHKQCGTYVS